MYVISHGANIKSRTKCVVVSCHGVVYNKTKVATYKHNRFSLRQKKVRQNIVPCKLPLTYYNKKENTYVTNLYQAVGCWPFVLLLSVARHRYYYHHLWMAKSARQAYWRTMLRFLRQLLVSHLHSYQLDSHLFIANKEKFRFYYSWHPSFIVYKKVHRRRRT